MRARDIAVAGLIAPERCALEPMASLAGAGGATTRRESIPGVYVQATAVANLLRGEELRRLEPLARNIIVDSFPDLAEALGVVA